MYWDKALYFTRRKLMQFSFSAGSVLSGGLTGCSSDPSARNADPGDSAIHVIATVAMVGDLVRQVGGDRILVTTLMGSGVDPHLYKPIRDDFRLLQSADVIFAVGLMLEGRLHETLGRLSENREVLALGDRLPPESLLGGDGTGTETEPAHPDPHIWMDIALWSQVLPAIAELLTKKMPECQTEFQRRAETVATELQGLHEYGRTVIGSIPESSRVLITSHDAFHYFGRAYGLQVLGVQGLSTESEAGLLRVNELVDLLVSRQVAAVFVETSVPRKSIEALIEGAASRGHRVRIGGSLYSDAMGAAGTWEGTYAGMLDHNLTVVARALGGTAPMRGYSGRLSMENEG
jgi:manganese/zinc/iron transport system substrate-binding protein